MVRFRRRTDLAVSSRLNRLAYARAMLKQEQGDNAGALVLFDALTNSRSDFDHARAAAVLDVVREVDGGHTAGTEFALDGVSRANVLGQL